MDPLLEPVGLGEVESAVYLRLIAHPRQTQAELSSALGKSPTRVRGALVLLTEAGLVSKLPTSPARYVPAPPEIGIDALVLRRQERLEGLRGQARDLARQMADTPHGRPGDLIEVIEGDAPIMHHLVSMQLGAQREVDIVDCPPYLFGQSSDNDEERQALRRGVRYRAIYHAPVLDQPGKLANVLDFIGLGEQARVLPDIHLKMIIVDRQLAMIPLRLAEAETGVRILVRQSPLLDALVTCFGLLWEEAVPLGSLPGPGGPGDRDRELLAMLAAGLKDRAISRALGVTERTVTRRVTQLMAHLGARTRFQAALQAARRGWL
ncbi:helix-turn-helix domain-containing protein [Longispora albida]|uniref:helix-turn-helix domain-containing protein n=1 Tax=Longispora albida TaxID=203523 RepID=UPI0003800509|nr:helix-turn-helix domain-containing protein [Longispora albida]